MPVISEPDQPELSLLGVQSGGSRDGDAPGQRAAGPAGQRGTVSPFSVGDPGRAGLELPAGFPGARLGHADVELSAAAFAGMLIQAAACRGLQHRVTATARQDAFAIARHCDAGGTDRAVAIVCDGVGSFGRSDEAAEFASRQLAGLGAEGMPWPEAFARTNAALRALAEHAAAGTADPAADGMATTAVAVAVHREAGDCIAEAAWVGDSTLWHLAGDGHWELLSGSPDDDAETDYHSTGVKSLPSADGSCSHRVFRISGGALFVMSDGVGNPLRWSSDVQDALAGWWLEPPDPFTFAAQVSFARRSHLDDRTVIGIWPDADMGTGGDEGEP